MQKKMVAFWPKLLRFAGCNVNESVVNSAPTIRPTISIASGFVWLPARASTPAVSLSQQCATITVFDIPDLPVKCIDQAPQKPSGQHAIVNNAQPQRRSTNGDREPNTATHEIPSTSVFESDDLIQQQQQQHPHRTSENDVLFNMLRPLFLPFSELAAATMTARQKFC